VLFISPYPFIFANNGEIYAGAVAWYEPTTCPLASMRSNLYGFPSAQSLVKVRYRYPSSPAAKVELEVTPIVAATLFTFAIDTVTDFVPVFFTDKVTPSVPVKSTSFMLIEDDPMNPTVKAPIHAATAMLTATVTAMSMIDATTGLRAFAFFLIFLNVFISLSIPPLGLMSMLDGLYNLNLTT
jgi:hypothetical protein